MNIFMNVDAFAQARLLPVLFVGRLVEVRKRLAHFSVFTLAAFAIPAELGLMQGPNRDVGSIQNRLMQCLLYLDICQALE